MTIEEKIKDLAIPGKWNIIINNMGKISCLMQSKDEKYMSTMYFKMKYTYGHIWLVNPYGEILDD